jgi:cytochrome c553/mono/diheme cytochrome c family protein
MQLRSPCLLAGLILALGGFARAEETPPADQAGDLEFYAARVRPLLEARCYKCHGPKTQESDLRLDTYAGLQRGGAAGELAVAGNPDQSLLLMAVGYQNEDLQMPPDAKLSDAEIEILRHWVARGMPHPDAGQGGRELARRVSRGSLEPPLWSFQPPVATSPPVSRNLSWSRTPIDQFVLAELEAHGLEPAPEADQRTLLRRVTFDLTGLPPSADEIESFLRDSSPDAYDRVVDRLLGSPQYGPRWGRHWLDVARYADSNGLDENVAHGNAWRYRDYVIDAWNQDKSFDQFVREQIAGDLLPAADDRVRRERLIATGFLSLGAKVLAEVDERKMEMDIIDEQIDTIGRTLLGLTLGCARCHDHKFDPIRTDDYYALAGVFRSTRTMEHFRKVARWNEQVIATARELSALAAHQRKLDEHKAAIQRVIETANQSLLASLGSGAELPKDAETHYSEATRAELKKLRSELEQCEKAQPALSSAMGVEEGTVADMAVCIRGNHLATGRVVPRGIPAALAVNAPAFSASESGRRELAEWLASPHNPLTARVLVNRVWRWHFGRGIVESTDNLGRLGDPPSNPELLDWLAVQFVRDGWSIKKLQRLIVRSATYRQMSATGAPAGSRIVDPDNRLLGHFPVRRLEAEVVRDALLSVSGRLDTAMGGSLLHVGNRDYLFDHTSKDNTNYDSRRRAVYLPVIRNNLYDLFQLFDATDATVPNGDRATSTVATQALFMLNSPLLLDCARALAREAEGWSQDRAERIRRLYERCFARPATADEIERAVAFVDDFGGRSPVFQCAGDDGGLEAWTALCHALLASNEFLYVR